MVPSTAGAIMLVRFPLSDLSRSKLRPAVALAEAGREDWILCQVTSNSYSDSRAITLLAESFRQGGLQRVSYARPGKLFTANRELMTSEKSTTFIGASYVHPQVERHHKSLLETTFQRHLGGPRWWQGWPCWENLNVPAPVHSP